MAAKFFRKRFPNLYVPDYMVHTYTPLLLVFGFGAVGLTMVFGT